MSIVAAVDGLKSSVAASDTDLPLRLGPALEKLFERPVGSSGCTE